MWVLRTQPRPRAKGPWNPNKWELGNLEMKGLRTRGGGQIVPTLITPP